MASRTRNTVQSMSAAVIVEPGRIELRQVPIPEPSARSIRVRIEGCGVCASNIPPFEGRPWFEYPMESGQLGHEAWGIVDALGPDVRGFAPGQRVALLSNHAYAEFDIASVDASVALPPALDGKCFPGEPLGCAMNIFARSCIVAGHTVAIVGAGFLGLLLTRLASFAGAKVLVLSRRAYALELASTMGASSTIPSRDRWQALDVVKQLTAERLCDVVIEAAGKQETLDLAGDLVRERGRLVIAGYHQDGMRQVNLQQWNWRGIDVINAHERDERIYVQGMRRAIEAIAGGEIDPLPLYTHRLPLSRLDEALRLTRDRPDGLVKALIIM